MMKRLLAVLGPHVENGARLVLLLLLSLAAVVFLIYQGQALSHPYPLDYGEAPLVDQAMRMAAGQNIYRSDISSPPYTISNYPPLYVLSLVPFVKVFGPNFLAGRIISFLCSLASGTFLALIVYAHTADRTAAIVTGLLFVAIPYVVHWSPLLRIDMLALACSTGGLYLLARWPTARWSAVASVLLFVAAIYTRQSYALAAPLAAFVWLATHGWRRAAGLAALVGGLVLALFLALNALTQGGFFFNVVTANVNEFDIQRLEWNLRRLRDAAPVLLLFGGVSLVLAPGRVRLWPLLVPYLIGGALSSLERQASLAARRSPHSPGLADRATDADHNGRVLRAVGRPAGVPGGTPRAGGNRGRRRGPRPGRRVHGPDHATGTAAVHPTLRSHTVVQRRAVGSDIGD